MTQTEQEMQKAVNRFYVIQKEYYNGEIDDKELTNSVTQPFWQSMRLSKRRIASKGLRMEVPVWEIHVKGPEIHTGRVQAKQDGADIIGTSTRNVMTHRTFYRNDKRIYSKKEQEIASVHVLKANVQEEEAACPNCGHVGKIADYIDGCDYCGSVFTVNDFEAKISGFFLEENISQKVKKILKGAAIFCGILVGLLIVLTVISLFGIVNPSLVGDSEKDVTANAITLIFSTSMIPAMWRTMTGLVMIYSIAGVLLLCFMPRQIVGEEIVKGVIPAFSARDFFQNLEYKLRNIHFADASGEVASFASFDLQEIVKGYADVVDCNLRKLRFMDIRQEADKYYVTALAELKLSLYNGRRIRNKHECVKLLVSGKKEVFLKNTLAIREYKCPNCHSSVGLLEGGNCSYCDSKLDYENYSWVIDKYEKKMKQIHTYQWIKLGFVGIFLLMLLCNVYSSSKEEGGIIELYEEVSNAEQVLNDFFEEVETPDELGLAVTLKEQKNEYRQRSYQYITDNGAEVSAQYQAKLENIGYVLDEDSITESSYDIYMPVEYQDEKGYIKLTVSFEAQGLVVELTVTEFIGET